MLNARFPFTLPPADALVIARVVAGQPFVGLILTARGKAQILAPVVQSVAVDVVDLQARIGLHDEAVHVERAASAIVSCVVHSVAAAVETPAAQ